MTVFNMMDAWSTCNVTIVKTSSMWKKVLWSNFPPMYWLPMSVAFSFFCCCLILLWFCTLPALLVFVVLLAVLFCLILLLLVLPFSEIFGFVLFCFVFLILTLFHNLTFTNCFLYFGFCFVLLSFVIIFLFCCYFTTLQLDLNPFLPPKSPGRTPIWNRRGCSSSRLGV